MLFRFRISLIIVTVIAISIFLLSLSRLPTHALRSPAQLSASLSTKLAQDPRAYCSGFGFGFPGWTLGLSFDVADCSEVRSTYVKMK